MPRKKPDSGSEFQPLLLILRRIARPREDEAFAAGDGYELDKPPHGLPPWQVKLEHHADGNDRA